MHVTLLLPALLFLVPWLLQWLWNMTCPQALGLQTVTYWQAFRLILITGILFGAWRIV